MNLKNRHFLKLLDFTTEEITSYLDLAAELKAAKKAGREVQRMKGKNIALIFEKTSTRTRCAFEVAARDQGGGVTYLEPSASQIGHKESIKDTARVLGRMYDGIEYRGFGQDVVEELAKYAGVPVFNGLTNEFHPTQMLADALTMREHSGKPLNQTAFAYVGDARYNMANSLLVLGAKLGMDVRIGAPKTLWPSENIVAYREENGEIASRAEIKKVPRLGAKAFEQAAGFLRIPNAKNILDNTGVHPESYPAVKALFKKLAITDLDDSAKAKLKALNLKETAEELGLGQETLKDIIADLLKPGRDLRDDFEAPVLRQDVLELKDLSVGQKLEGTVRNVVDFGAFVDIGVHEDGLIHISEMSKSFVNHPSQVVSVGDLVTVWVSKVDLEHEKLNLSLVNPRESN